MAKKILKYDFDVEYDFLLLAIICSHKDYRLCFELNNHLKLKLKRDKDIELITRQKSKNIFSNYFFCSPDHEQFRLINNKGSLGAFIPEMKSIDFFVMIRNLSHKKKVDDLILSFKKLDIINGVYELFPDDLKSAENFLIID